MQVGDGHLVPAREALHHLLDAPPAVVLFHLLYKENNTDRTYLVADVRERPLIT